MSHSHCPWRIQDGKGRTVAVTNGANVKDTVAMGSQTYEAWLALEPTTDPTGAVIRISNAGTAATAAKDLLIKTTDPPVLVKVSPGDVVCAWGLGDCTLHITEATG